MPHAPHKVRLPTPAVHVASIEHRHGTNMYAAADRAALDAEIAAFCIEYWAERGDTSIVAHDGLSDADIIAAYFEGHDSESLSISEATLASTVGASSPFAELICAGQRLAEQVEEALHVHIYDIDEAVPADCNYGQALATWKNLVPQPSEAEA